MNSKGVYRRTMLLFGVPALGVACFCAGRFSAQPVVLVHEVPPVNAARIDATVPVSNAVNTQGQIVTPALPALPAWNDQRWRALQAQLATPNRNASLAQMLEELAATDPDHAMALAKAEENLEFREVLIQATLHGWARKSPLDAANWAMSLPDSGRRDQSLSSVFSGAITTSPDTAISVERILIQGNPGAALGSGSRLIEALCQAGDFNAAALFADGGENGQRNAWLAEAYSSWASFQPATAAQSAQNLADSDARSQALQGIAGGWAQADPAGLVQFASQLSAGTDRSGMLGQALKSWTQSDPVSAANWMNANAKLGPDLDQGAAQVASVETLPPASAMPWAEVISDPQLRSSTIATVLRNWADTDPAAAQNYFQSTSYLLPGDRQRISETLANLAQIAPSQ